MSTNYNSQFNDTILWVGRPVFKPYVIRQIFRQKIFLVYACILLALAIFSGWENKKYDWARFSILLAVLLAISIAGVVTRLVAYRNLKYWITKDAVYFQGGIINRRVVSIQKSAIIRVDISETTAEKRFHTGTVIIDTGETRKIDYEDVKVFKEMLAIQNPEQVLRFL